MSAVDADKPDPGDIFVGGKRLRRNHALAFIALTLGIDMAGVGLIIPVMPDLIRSLTTASVGEAAAIGGWLVFAYAAMQFFFAPIAGNLGDRYGRRVVLLAALGGLAVDYLIMALAPTLWLLFIGRIVAGIAGSSWSVANAYVADISTKADRAKNFGVVSAGAAAGLVLAPAAGGLLGDIHVRAPFYAAAALTAMNFLYGFFVLPESLSEDKKRRFDWRRANPVAGIGQVTRFPAVAGILCALFMMQTATQALVHIWTYFTTELLAWSSLDIGVSVTFYAVTLIAVQAGLTGRVVRRVGEVRAALIGLTAALVAYLILAFANTGWHMYLGILVGALTGLVTPSMQALMTRAVPDDTQGELQGSITSTVALTIVVGPVIMTNLFALFTGSKMPYFPGAPFIASAGLILASAGVFWMTARRADLSAGVADHDDKAHMGDDQGACDSVADLAEAAQGAPGMTAQSGETNAAARGGPGCREN